MLVRSIISANDTTPLFCLVFFEEPYVLHQSVWNIYLLITYQRCKGNEFLPQPQNYNPFVCATRCRRFLIFHAIISAKPKSLSLKYQRFLGIGIRKFEFVEKTRFFSWKIFPLFKNDVFLQKLDMFCWCILQSELCTATELRTINPSA